MAALVARLESLGFDRDDSRLLADHFLEAERRGKSGHGLARIDWLETLPEFDPGARPVRLESTEGFERWQGRGALGYLVLAAICRSLLADQPLRARVVVAEGCFPTGVLGYWTRWLASEGLVGLLTTTSPRRLAAPGGDEPVTGTNPLSIGIPSSDGRPIVTDVSMGRVTHGDVITGLASEKELVPFGGDQAHKSFALAVGLELLVESMAGDGYGAFLVVASPPNDPVPGFRELAAGVRLPGDA